MKLKDYFKEQQNLQISTDQKLFLYDKIITKQSKTSHRFFRFVNMKSFAYGFMSLALLVGIYGIYFINGNISYEDFIIKNGTAQVSADYIAKVIDFNGDFYVAHEDKLYKTNKISDGDSVVLKKGSEIIFDINSGTQAKLVGPARFSLSMDGDTYQLIISEGDYIQMESTAETGTNIEVTLDKDDITIASKENLNVLITKTDNEYKINNQGGTINVTKNKKTKQVDNQQLLAIKDNDISLINNVEDFKETFTKKGVSQTFAVKDDNKQVQDTTSALIKEINTNTNKNTTVNNTEVANQLGVVDNQQIPTEEQSKILNNILDKDSLLWTLESIYKAQLLGNTKEYTSYTNNISLKIQEIYKAFNIKYNKGELLSDISNLKTKLGEGYYVPSSKLNNLTTLGNRITYIKNLGAGSNTDESSVDESWSNLMKQLPSNLILK